MLLPNLTVQLASLAAQLASLVAQLALLAAITLLEMLEVLDVLENLVPLAQLENLVLLANRLHRTNPAIQVRFASHRRQPHLAPLALLDPLANRLYRKKPAILALQIASEMVSHRASRNKVSRHRASRNRVRRNKASSRASADSGRIAKTVSIDLANRASSRSCLPLHHLYRAIQICPNTSWRISIAGTTPRLWPRCGLMPMRKTWAR